MSKYGRYWSFWYGKIGNPARNLCLLLCGCEAPQWLRPSDAARIEADDIEAPLELLTAVPDRTRPTRRSTPDPPGPPGLTNTDPIRFARSDAGIRASAICVVAPVGWS